MKKENHLQHPPGQTGDFKDERRRSHFIYDWMMVMHNVDRLESYQPTRLSRVLSTMTMMLCFWSLRPFRGAKGEGGWERPMVIGRGKSPAPAPSLRG